MYVRYSLFTWLLLACSFVFGQQEKPLELTQTAVKNIKALQGFQVEQLYEVPQDAQGSWVNLTIDPQGRLITSDQYGKLYRITPPKIGGKPEEMKIEPIDLQIGQANGLLYAFDSLYVVVPNSAYQGSGIYRVRDTDGDDKFDDVKLLRPLQGKGEHGPHAVLLSPDKQSLYVVCGNHTDLTKIDTYRVPRVWDEDQLLPRMWDARGHAKGRLAPGGWIAKIDPEGKEWELVSTGYRNEFDAAFNRDGELFTFDADMEWDINTPWYRPTRICHATSGSEFGWRSGTGKWPSYYPDSLPSVVDIGPGSPTGVTFGYGAKFPAKYQNALFILDWSYGKVYAVHLRPDGSSYRGEAEEFMTGTPLPVTDAIINPHDGAMYITTGGRRTSSFLYRVTYTGKESTALVPPAPDAGAAAREARRKLEEFHVKKDPAAVAAAWPNLGSDDRFLRYAARTVLEHQPVNTWQDKALKETNPQASLSALLALTRVGARAVQPEVLKALDRISFDKLTHAQRLELLRVYGLTFIRLGEPEEAVAAKVAAKFEPYYPSKNREENAELSKLLVYLQSPLAATKTMKLLAAAPTQEEQMDYVLALRNLETGWTMEQREEYFRWFLKAASYRGGASFGGFVQNIKNEAVAFLSADEKKALKAILEAKPQDVKLELEKPRPLVQEWKVAEVLPVVESGLHGRDYQRGRQLFAVAKCYACHRFNNEGGATGPDLSGVSGRFNAKDLLESIIEPSKTISDQYAAVVIQTTDGQVVTGRIVNLNGDTLKVNTDMYDPDKQSSISRKKIELMEPSKLSMMPQGLLNTLKTDEILDLMAYLLSRGDPNHAAFQK